MAKSKKLVDCKHVPVKVPESVAGKVAELVASGQDVQYRRKDYTAEVSEVEPTTRTDVSIITSDHIDRDFEIVDPSGIELEDYRANPVVLFQHDDNQPAGKALWIKADGSRLVMKTYYPERPAGFEGEWLPDKAFALVQAGLLKGKSIGFIPLEVRDPTPEELQRHPDCQRVISRCLLLEVSCVTIPSNPNALITAINKGAIKFNPVPKPVKRKPVPVVKQVQRVDLDAVLTLDPSVIAELVVKNLTPRV